MKCVSIIDKLFKFMLPLALSFSFAGLYFSTRYDDHCRLFRFYSISPWFSAIMQRELNIVVICCLSRSLLFYFCFPHQLCLFRFAMKMGTGYGGLDTGTYEPPRRTDERSGRLSRLFSVFIVVNGEWRQLGVFCCYCRFLLFNFLKFKIENSSLLMQNELTFWQ